MGAWGTAIFSDDLAADVRDEYRDHLGNGLSGPEATVQLVAAYSDAINDRDESDVFWLALAATQWKHGRLEEDVKAKALRVIASGHNLRRWTADNPEEAMKRAAVLEKLKG